MENRKPKTENRKLVKLAGFTFSVFGFLFSISLSEAEIRLILCFALISFASPAAAVSTGISGTSGKQGANCVDCHSGGVDPLVRLDGPRQVYADTLATFRFVVRTQSTRQQFAGFNAAASDGVLEPVFGEGAHVENGELTHDAPKGAVADETEWAFTWRAPPAAGEETIFAAGLSANGTGTRSGDGTGLLQVSVTVLSGPEPGDANCDKTLSAADLIAIARSIAVDTPEGCDGADANCDGMIDAADVESGTKALFDAEVDAACTDVMAARGD